MGYSRCCAPGCTFVYGKGLLLKGFPKNEELRAKWIAAFPAPMYLLEKRPKWPALCELHFTDADFERFREDGKRKLKANAIPSVWNTCTMPVVACLSDSDGENDNGINAGENRWNDHSYPAFPEENRQNDRRQNDHSYSKKPILCYYKPR